PGVITTVAGSGALGFGGDGRQATSAQLANPFGVAIDAQGRIFIADTFDQRIRRVDTDGTITTVAGTGTLGYTGDGGPALGAQFHDPNYVALDAQGRIYIGDTANQRVRRIETNGTIVTIAGTGASGYSGDGGPATSARLASPYGVSVDAQGRVYIADSANQRVRRIEADG